MAEFGTLSLMIALVACLLHAQSTQRIHELEASLTSVRR